MHKTCNALFLPISWLPRTDLYFLRDCNGYKVQTQQLCDMLHIIFTQFLSSRYSAKEAFSCKRKFNAQLQRKKEKLRLVFLAGSPGVWNGEIKAKF